MADAPHRHSRRVERLLCLLLLVGALAVFEGVTECEFVNFDDIQYITENPHVRSGLTLKGLRWAFAESHAGNWHPLTWLSHMLDCQGFALRPGMHHLINLLLHTANTVLLFLVLSRATGALWRSAFVAALFAVHPLHVESVAWVSERKDVLSTFFGILALWAYVAYARRPAIRKLVPVFLLFAAGLLCKPMLVTLPFVFLLLDYWPLGRLQAPRFLDTRNHGARRPFNMGLVWEKVPLFLLSALVSVVTFLVQKKGGMVLGLDLFPLPLRLANALMSYVEYMGKMIWPARLAVYYVHPAAIPAWKTAGAGFFLLCLTALLLRGARKHPYLAVGWLWFIGTLVPVIGLLHVGGQAMADRYTYIPGIGLFIMAAWGLPALVGEGRVRRRVLAASALVVLLVLGIRARVQVGTWRDSVTLWKHAVAVTDHNYVAHNMLGGALAREGRLQEAMDHFSEALHINPDYEKAHYYMGLALMEQGRYGEAMAHLSRALDLHFDLPEVIYDLRGVAMLRQGRHEGAVEQFGAALQLNPRYVPAHLNLGEALEQTGRVQEAVSHYSTAMEIDPASALPHFHLGRVLFSQGKVREAAGHFAKALQINPDLAEAHYNLGVVLERQGKVDEAVRCFSRALQIKPGYVEARNNLGVALARQGRCREAVTHFSAVLRIQPDHALARSNLDHCLQLMGKGKM